MMKLYLAGPMRGKPNYNFDEFDRMEQQLKDEGYTVVSPAAMDRLYEGWDKYVPDDFVVNSDFVRRCMKRDLDAIYDCDAIYLLKGWEESTGAKAEYALAVCLGLQVIYQIDN